MIVYRRVVFVWANEVKVGNFEGYHHLKSFTDGCCWLMKKTEIFLTSIQEDASEKNPSFRNPVISLKRFSYLFVPRCMIHLKNFHQKCGTHRRSFRDYELPHFEPTVGFELEGAQCFQLFIGSGHLASKTQSGGGFVKF